MAKFLKSLIVARHSIAAKFGTKIEHAEKATSIVLYGSLGLGFHEIYATLALAVAVALILSVIFGGHE